MAIPSDTAKRSHATEENIERTPKESWNRVISHRMADDTASRDGDDRCCAFSEIPPAGNVTQAFAGNRGDQTPSTQPVGS